MIRNKCVFEAGLNGKIRTVTIAILALTPVDISRSGVKKKQYLEKTLKRRVVQFCLG